MSINCPICQTPNVTNKGNGQVAGDTSTLIAANDCDDVLETYDTGITLFECTRDHKFYISNDSLPDER